MFKIIGILNIISRKYKKILDFTKSLIGQKSTNNYYPLFKIMKAKKTRKTCNQQEKHKSTFCKKKNLIKTPCGVSFIMVNLLTISLVTITKVKKVTLHVCEVYPFTKH